MPGITNPSEKYFKDGQWTFDGTVWRPQNQLLAYRDTIREVYSETKVGAGTATFDFSTCPAGYVYVLTYLFCVNLSTAAAYIVAYVYDGVSSIRVDLTAYETVTRIFRLPCQLVLKASDRLRYEIYSCANGDVLRGSAHGYKFLIAE